jgi:CHAT domain-containing protein/tetratricopeptide (TPR) repeat protein
MLCLGFFFPFPGLFSQSSSNSAYERCFKDGNRLYHQGKYDSAAVKFRCFLNPSPELVLLSDTPAAGQIISAQSEERVLKACLKISLCFIQLNRYDSAIYFLEQGLLIIKKTGFRDEKLLRDLCFQKANCLFLVEEYNKAIDFYCKALSCMHAGDPLMASAYMNLGDIYFITEDVDNAIDCYTKALVFSKNSSPGDGKKSADLFANLGAAYLKKNNTGKAFFYFTMAKKIYEQGGHYDSLALARLYINTGSACLKDNDLLNSLEYDRQALRYLGPRRTNFSGEILIIYKNAAAVFAKSGMDDSCFIYLSRALDLATGQDLPGKVETADLCRLLGNCKRNQKDLPAALVYYQRSITALVPGNNDGEDDIATVSANPVWLLEYCRILTDRAEVFWQYGSSHPGEKDMINRSFSDNLAALKLMKAISSGLGREGSKLVFNQDFTEVYTRVLNLGFVLMNAEDDRAKEMLFGFSEKCRTNVLLEIINEKMARHACGIPPDLLVKDSLIQSELACLNSNYFSGFPMTGKGDKHALLNSVLRISDLYQQHDSLVMEYEENYPAYYDMKYKDSHISLAEVRQKLGPEESLVEYFTGDTTLFIFLVSRNRSVVKKVRVDNEFHHGIRKYNQLLSGAEVENFSGISKMLYHNLIAPIKNSINKETKLIIIPDERLAMIPFETLVSDSSGMSGDHYLIRDFGICYHFSATLWGKSDDAGKNDPGTGKKSVSFTGYSPGFQSENKNLPFADEEILKVTQLLNDHGFRAVSVLHESATKEHFKKNTSAFEWIHLATHSEIDLENPERCGLLFTGNPGNKKEQPGNDLLYLGEIYNLKLHAGLVVMSACATGRGKIIRSEGAMALTRGFLYAGASNIVYSLWNVTDRHSRDFMVGFYQGLVSGLSYSAALRAEKLKMIADPATSLPTIWAPFVLLGR